MENELSSTQLEALQQLDSCTVSNAIETFNLRLRNEGFANSTVRCAFPSYRRWLGTRSPVVFVVQGHLQRDIVTWIEPTGGTTYKRSLLLVSSSCKTLIITLDWALS